MRKMLLYIFLQEFVSGVFFTTWIMNLLLSGMSQRDTAFACAAWFFSRALFEIPTGYFADFCGRKLSTVLGGFTQALAFTILSLGVGKNWTWIALGLSGISTTLISGAMTAWFLSVHRVATRASGEDKFFLSKELTGRTSMIAGAIVSAKLSGFDPRLSWSIAAGIAFAALITALSIPRIEDSVPVEASQEQIGTQSLERHPIITRALIFFLISSFLFGQESGIRNFIYQPYVVSLAGGEVAALGLFQAILAMVRFCGGIFYRKFLFSIQRKEAMVAIGFGLFAFAEFWCASKATLAEVLPVYLVAVFALGWAFPVRELILSEMAPPRWRALTFSLDSSVQNLAAGFSVVAIAFSVQGGNFHFWWKVAGAFLLSSQFFIVIARKAFYRFDQRESRLEIVA